MNNIVYIATSLDGYIADKHGGLDWLQIVPNRENSDFGWSDFIKRIDAIVMGRKTFESVLSFDVPWPYAKKVFVLSNTLFSLPEEIGDKAELISGTPAEISENLNMRGFENLYIDGGYTIQRFLEADLIEEIIITRLPVLLGGGTPLFGSLSNQMVFDHISTKVLLSEMVVSHYKRQRS